MTSPWPLGVVSSRREEPAQSAARRIRVRIERRLPVLPKDLCLPSVGAWLAPVPTLAFSIGVIDCAPSLGSDGPPIESFDFLSAGVPLSGSATAA